jgi:hypothetical protein
MVGVRGVCCLKHNRNYGFLCGTPRHESEKSTSACKCSVITRQFNFYGIGMCHITVMRTMNIPKITGIFKVCGMFM